MYTVHYRDESNLTQSRAFAHRWEALQFCREQLAAGRPAHVACPCGACMSLCPAHSDLA